MTQQTIKLSIVTVSTGTFGIDETPVAAEATYDVEQNLILKIASCSEEQTPASIIEELEGIIAEQETSEAPIIASSELEIDLEDDETIANFETEVKLLISFEKDGVARNYEVKNAKELRIAVDAIKRQVPSNILEAHGNEYLFPTTPRAHTPMLDLLRENSGLVAGTVAALALGFTAAALRNRG